MNEMFRVKSHGKYTFCPTMNRILFKVNGYSIFRQTETQQQFGTLPGCKKWTTPAEAEAAAARASQGRTEGIEIKIGTIPFDS